MATDRRRHGDERPFLALADKAAAEDWSLDRDVDWERRIVPPRRLSPAILVHTVSQLLYGERAALTLCLRLRDELGETGAIAAFLDRQIAEERRHETGYRRYLEGLGEVAPPDPALDRAYARAAEWRGSPVALVLACHGLLEAEAVKAHAVMAPLFRCPVLHRLNALVARDEARHVAFGRLYLGQAVPRLPRAERRRLADWLEELWNTALSDEGSDATWLGKRLRADYRVRRWSEHRRRLRVLGLLEAEAARE
jgi:hypothetical protein